MTPRRSGARVDTPGEPLPINPPEYWDDDALDEEFDFSPWPSTNEHDWDLE